MIRWLAPSAQIVPARMVLGVLMGLSAVAPLAAAQPARFGDLGLRAPEVVAHRLGPALRGTPPPAAPFGGAPALSQVRLDEGQVQSLLSLLAEDDTYGTFMLACRRCEIGLLLSEAFRTFPACVSFRCQQIRVATPSGEALFVLSPRGSEQRANLLTALLPAPASDPTP